jgi:hypothetical protein
MARPLVAMLASCLRRLSAARLPISGHFSLEPLMLKGNLGQDVAAKNATLGFFNSPTTISTLTPSLMNPKITPCCGKGGRGVGTKTAATPQPKRQPRHSQDTTSKDQGWRRPSEQVP